MRLAGRWHEGLTRPYVYGPAAGGPEYSGEIFPLDVPPRALLVADASTSQQNPTAPPGTLTHVIIEGPLYTGSPVPTTILFRAGATDYFTPEGGLDGTEIAPFGIEVRGGLRGVFIDVDGDPTSRPAPLWPQIPPFTPPPADLPAMSIRIERVWFAGRGAAYDLDAHILNSSLGDFSVVDCRFTTTQTTCVDPISGSPVPDPPTNTHTGQALIHLLSKSLPGTTTSFRPAFTGNELTVLPDSTGARPNLPWGLVVDADANSDIFLDLRSLEVDGAASPTAAEGIAIGVELASKTGNPFVGGQNAIPRYDLSASTISNCAVFGLAVASGGVPPATVTQLEVSGNWFRGNGVRRWESIANSYSTHNRHRGAAIHALARELGSRLFGSIASNVVTQNVTGIAVMSDSLSAPDWFEGTDPPPVLRISENEVSFQALSPFPTSTPTPFCPNSSPVPADSNGDGVGVILDDNTGFNDVGPGLLDSHFIVESNRIFENQRHGVWVVLTQAGSPGPPGPPISAGSNVSPVLRNNRIYNNATVALPTTGVPGEGVRLDFQGALYMTPTGLQGGPGLRFEPALVNETVVYTTNPNGGLGVNNVAGVMHPFSRPTLVNSIVYFNGPGFAGPDLAGFSFTAPAVTTGGLVSFSDFCGGPWAPLGVMCGTQAAPPVGTTHGCISYDPLFDLTADPPQFLPNCAGTGSVGTCGCAAPPAGSPCIDAGSDSVPFIPVSDANGAPRILDLYADPTPPFPLGDVDMGAVEKQTCTP